MSVENRFTWLKDKKTKLPVLISFDYISCIISIDNEQNSETIKFTNVVGCHRMRGKSLNDFASYFTIFCYPYRIQNGNGKKPKRRLRKVYTFQIFVHRTYEENVNLANLWVEKINDRSIALPAPHRLGLATSFRRKLIVFVNPYSGPGRALQIFQEKVMPVFAEADIVCRLVITERANHARDLVYKMDLLQWDGIVIVSGDGLVYEVINGLFSRADRDQALRIPMGIVPGGSGNALAAACCFDPTDSCKFDYAIDSAVVIAKPNYANLKLIHFQTKNENIISFMSIGWGLLSDIDIESEKFRRLLGPARFTAGAVVRWASLRTYRGRLSFKLVDDEKNLWLNSKKQQQQSQLVIGQSKSIDLSFLARPKSLRELPPMHSYEIQELAVDYEPELSFESDHSTNPSSYVNEFPPEAIDHESAIKTHDGPQSNKVPFSTVVPMPKLDQPVPSDWLVIEDDFILMYAVYVTHIGSDLPYMPCSNFDDDCMYLTVVRANGTSKLNLAKFLLTIESAQHLTLPCVEVYPVSAFRLERLTEGGVLAVDGEHIKCSGPVQACVTRHKATIMTAHGQQNQVLSRL